VVVTADRDYHARMQAAAVAGAQPVQFPAFCPERRFALPNRQVLIGRRSRSRGIEPDIDLTGPPEDAAVSHAHALLVTVPEGWAVVDLDSANGTYVNEATDPIEANVPVPVHDGDRIHVGAWTTMTLRREA
jgi:pSer/pThr/pTyr-binding forkhead associated (FHA) protein